MDEKLTFKYDRVGDILYIEKCPPYPEQESEELGDEIIARLNQWTRRSGLQEQKSTYSEIVL